MVTKIYVLTWCACYATSAAASLLCLHFGMITLISIPLLLLQVRLNFLSQLLHEAYGYLHSFLTASILNRKLMHHPMQRDVEITPEGAAAMRASLAHCKKVRVQMGETCCKNGL